MSEHAIRDQMQLFVIFLLRYICFDHHGVDGSWIPLGPPIMPYPPTATGNLQRVEIGKDGTRVAIGSSNNSISVYDLVSIPKQSNGYLPEWKFTAHLTGVSGIHYSLSPNGQFLASRHQSINKQVQVWEILNSTSSDANSTIYKEEHISSSLFQPELSVSTENVDRIGTFWCVADGQAVKLGQAGSKLYLAMSCETWLENRGKVQVFVRGLSQHSNHSSVWDTSLPPLMGKNAGDLFGSALSIAEAPSRYSEYEFRLVVSSPGYNFYQGLVQIYTASYSLSSGWDQMGGDLTGSHIGEHFGATLDISGNINDQPFLIVGSPGWKQAEGDTNSTRGGDFGNDEESSESFDTGLVRLYHWRRSSSSFDSPRRWTLVGRPMLGRNRGDRFGSFVMISQTGERITVGASPIKYEDSFTADDHRGYLGVYERESFHSWGKAVNDVINYDKSSCRQLSQCFALNNYGSTIAIAFSNGTVRTYVDDTPYCSITSTEDLLTIEENDPSITPITPLNLGRLLDRQTCRTSDTLIEGRSLCLDQSVYKRGKYQTCLWESPREQIKRFSPTTSPVVPLANPTSINISVSPSTSPSFPLSVPAPGIPPIMLNQPISLEPSIMVKLPTMHIPQTSYLPSKSTMVDTGEPSVVDYDETEKPMPKSAPPTPAESEKPLGRLFNQGLSSSPTVVPSQFEVDSPVNQTKWDDTVLSQEATDKAFVFGLLALTLLGGLAICGWLWKRQFVRSLDSTFTGKTSAVSVSCQC